MTNWWTSYDTYALFMWLLFLLLLFSTAKILSWTVFRRKRPKIYDRPKQRGPLMRAFFGSKAQRATPEQKNWEKV